jgi:hypothetical protein
MRIANLPEVLLERVWNVRRTEFASTDPRLRNASCAVPKNVDTEMGREFVRFRIGYGMAMYRTLSLSRSDSEWDRNRSLAKSACPEHIRVHSSLVRLAAIRKHPEIP